MLTIPRRSHDIIERVKSNLESRIKWDPHIRKSELWCPECSEDATGRVLDPTECSEDATGRVLDPTECSEDATGFDWI